MLCENIYRKQPIPNTPGPTPGEEIANLTADATKAGYETTSIVADGVGGTITSSLGAKTGKFMEVIQPIVEFVAEKTRDFLVNKFTDDNNKENTNKKQKNKKNAKKK